MASNEEVHRLMAEGDGHTLRVMRYRLMDRVAALLKALQKTRS